MSKRWRLPSHDAARISQLEHATGVSPVVAQLLWNRGVYRPDDVKAFLEAKLTHLRNPEELPGAAEAADRLWAAVQAKRRITVYGDYDCDGMTATALLVNCLKLLGAEVNYYIPNRLEEGYGLSNDALRTLASRGSSLVISVDCGICSCDEANTARELGLELIVTDHHEMRDELPQAAALVHPRLPGTAYPFGQLCGAGVALKVAWALCKRAEGNGRRVSDRLREYLMSAVGLAAIGTVADVVPLIDENRVLVRYGLLSLKDRPPLGLAALLRITDLIKRPQLSSEDIAFTLAPRLNAAGRLGQGTLAVELLTTESNEKALSLAQYINELNSSRDSLERSVHKQAIDQIKEQFDPENDPALVLAGRGWHAGVIGIVAGRLAEKYNRPVVLISLDQLGVKAGVGSARSAGRFNLHAALAACGSHLLGHGGHAAAAGLKIDEANITAFRNEFVEYAASEFAAEDRQAELAIDAEAPLSQLTLQTVEQIETLAPFGCGNPRPVLCATGVTLTEPPKRIGSGERHLAVKLAHHGCHMRGVAFGCGDWAEPLMQHGGPIDIAYRPVINDFRGRRTVEVQLVDWKPVQQSVAVSKTGSIADC
jgi:single-stranded-DNA-specific exonuclease